MGEDLEKRYNKNPQRKETSSFVPKESFIECKQSQTENSKKLKTTFVIKILKTWLCS